jgi:hypothetical protein
MPTKNQLIALADTITLAEVPKWLARLACVKLQHTSKK